MKTVCPECNKEFEISFAKALAYGLNDEEKPKCDNCIFNNIFSKLIKEEKVKSLQQVLSELDNNFNELEIETESYSGGGNQKWKIKY